MEKNAPAQLTAEIAENPVDSIRRRARVIGRRLQSKTPELVRAASSWLQLFQSDQPPPRGVFGPPAAALVDRMDVIVGLFAEVSCTPPPTASKMMWQDVRLIENLSDALAAIPLLSPGPDIAAKASVLDSLASFHLKAADAGLSSDNELVRQLAQRSAARILDFFARADVGAIMEKAGRSASLSFWRRHMNFLDNSWQALVGRHGRMTAEDLRALNGLSLAALSARCLPYMAGRSAKPSTGDQPAARAQWLAMAALDDNRLLLQVIEASAKIIRDIKTGWVTKLSGATALIGHVDMADALPLLRPEQAAALLDADPAFSGVPGWQEAAQRHHLSIAAETSTVFKPRSL